MLSTQFSPSRTSSPESVNSSFFRAPSCFAHSLIVRVSADLKPVRWVPPSCVLMLFTKVNVFAGRLERDRLGMQGTPVADDPLHEFGQAALIVEGLFLRAPLALVLENDRERLVQE